VAHKRKTKGLVARSISNRERAKQIRSLFCRTDSLLIVVNPDPDSMASALALKRLLWKWIQTSTIAYIGKIQRLDNQAMIQLLKIPMVPLDRVREDEFSKKALVDSQPHHHEGLSQIKYDIVIDHHPITRDITASYIDIRPEYGANATIMIEYLKGADIKPSERLATALLYAIKVDTQNFERDATEEDVKEFRFIFKQANLNLLRKIESSEMSLDHLHYYRVALNAIVISKKRLFAHLGEVKSPDLCVQIAEFFHRIHGISWIFISGFYQGKLVIIMRNDGYRKNAGRLAQRAFGPFGEAGGHKGAARAEIPVETLTEQLGELNDKKVRSFLQKRLDRVPDRR
jgi:nanoRNase/pAp phosphatase (c-di-AMP/oligoRNAs hydrolase)